MDTGAEGSSHVTVEVTETEGAPPEVAFVQDDPEGRIGSEYRPRVQPEVATAWVGDELVVGHEALGRFLVLDPVSAQLWALFDGTVTIEELARDLADVTSVPLDDARRILTRMCRALAHDGFLADEWIPEPTPRRQHPWIDAESCLGRKMGLGRAEMAQVEVNRNWFRFGATLPGVVGPLVDGLRTMPVDERFIETIVFRGTPSRGGVPRLQQVFDSTGNLLYASRDEDAALDAFQRTISARIELTEGGAWVEAPVMARGDRAVVLDRAFTRAVTSFRKDLEAAGVRWAPAGLLRLQGSTLTAVANRVTGGPELDFEVASLVVHGDAVPERTRELLDVLELAKRWDQVHVDAFVHLFESGRTCRWTPQDAPEELVAFIDDALR